MGDFQIQALVVGNGLMNSAVVDPAMIKLQVASQTLAIDSVSQFAVDTGFNLSEELPLAHQSSIDPHSTPLTPQGFGLNFGAAFKVGSTFLPGAIMVKNESQDSFYLENVKLKSDKHGHEWEFECDSYISPPDPDQKYANLGIFYLKNKLYLPGDTPAGLVAVRKFHLELSHLWYKYDIYADLGFDFKLGGQFPNLPYPRRQQGLLSWLSSKTGVDEKLRKLLATVIEFCTSSSLQGLNISPDSKSFSSFLQLYQLHHRGEDPAFESALAHEISKMEKDDKSGYLLLALKEICSLFISPDIDFPVPESVYMPPSSLDNVSDLLMDDEEFGRQTVAGMHPTVIQLLQSFPRDDESEPSLLEKMVEAFLQSRYGLCAEEAIEGRKLFIIDYHDGFKRYVHEVNKLPGKKMYAPRAVFFSTNEGKMIPVAIELSLPQDEQDDDCTLKQVFSPDPITENHSEPTVNWLWELAKIHFSSVDFSYHELVSHWLRSHAVMEPIIVATKRSLHKVHPLYALLEPCFTNTVLINYLARRLLINNSGIISQNFTPDEFGLKICSDVYKSWRFDKQSVPEDLISRGMATRDPNSDDNVHLIHKDYPFAEDALEVWKVLKAWVKDYVNTVYKSFDEVKKDKELWAWWDEVRNQAHPDVTEGWPTVTSIDDLIKVLTTIFWIAGGHHAAVNFGQYDYAGFVPQRTSVTRELIPDSDVPETDAEWIDYILKTICSPKETMKVITILKLLSSHAKNEVYLGQLGNSNWTDKKREKAYKKFAQSVENLGEEITGRNEEAKTREWSNRVCKKTQLLYTLLYPTSDPGKTMQGIPYSTSI